MSYKNPLYLNGKGSTVDRLTALENVVNMLTDEMYEKRVKQAQTDIRETSDKVASIDETQKITFVASAEAGQIDEQTAAKHKEVFNEWEENTHYVVGNMRTYGEGNKNHLYKCKKEHDSMAIYPPPLVAPLWDIINEKHAGTIDDPIPITEDMAGQMIEYVKGLNYIESDVIYLMSREGMADGETISLPYFPSQLVGTYFTIVEAV